MKCILVVLVIGFASGKSQDSTWTKAIEDCALQRNVTFEQIAKTQVGDFSEADVNYLNCFTECFYSKFMFIRQGSVSIEVDNMKRYVVQHDGEEYKPIVEECAKSRGHNLCELSYNVYKCFTQQALQLNREKEMQQTTTPAKIILVSSPEQATNFPTLMSAPVPAEKQSQHEVEQPQQFQQPQIPLPNLPIALQMQPQQQTAQQEGRAVQNAQVQVPEPSTQEPETVQEEATVQQQHQDQQHQPEQLVVPLNQQKPADAEQAR